MSSIGTGYDLSVTTYSPDGRIFQSEYANKAVDNSGTAIGIKCKDGIVLGVEKLIVSKMLVEGSNRRIHAVDRHAGLAMAGLVADGRQIVSRARAEASGYKSQYGAKVGIQVLCERVASYVHLFTLYWWTRPCGVSVILGGYDQDGPHLYMVEPSGVSFPFEILKQKNVMKFISDLTLAAMSCWQKYFGTAIGKGRQAAKTEIEKLKLEEMTCREGAHAVAKIIYGVHDEAKDKEFELEMSWVCDESDRQFVRIPADLLQAVKASAEASLNEDMDAD